MSGITREIKERYGRMEGEGYQLEINLVSWNGREPKIDIRPWDENSDRCGKGITLTKEEARWVASILSQV